MMIPWGKVLIMDNEQLLTVTGVTENVLGDSHMQFDLLAPVTLLDEERLASWAVETGAYVLLQQNVAVAEFRDKISGTTMKYDRRIENADVINDIQAIARIHLYALNGLGRIVYVYIFTSIAFFVLIIACINFINLTTAKSSNRSREVGMRKVVGATRKNLIEQFFGESLLLSAIAMLAAMALVYLLLPVFNNLADKQLSIDIVGDSGLIIVLAGITLFTGIVSGSYPALFLSSLQTTKVLKGSSAVGSGNPLFRRILVIFQFTMVIILIISSMMIYRQLTYMENKDLGFDRELVAVLPMNPDLQADYLAFKNELLASAGIENVTSASSIPTAVGNINPVYWEGRGPDQYEIMNFAAVDADYIETFDMEIVAGRGFSEEFGSETENYIVNEEAVRLMGLESPIGKLFSIWTNEGQIVGVVKNFHSQSLHNEIAPLVLTLSTDWKHDHIFAKIRPESPQQTLQYLEATWNTFSPDYPFDYRFVEDVFRQQYSDDRQMGTILGYFTLLSIFISSLGLLGLTSFLAEQRTKEIGIRKVFGASVPDIVALVSKEFLMLLIVAITIAWPWPISLYRVCSALTLTEQTLHSGYSLPAAHWPA
ncbi:MAG: FtsX-like permease family protein [Gammaproteobacteria bacterium]|nr:FtsX-like permease family protein [Gammaproteobacteria bacterium]